MVMRQRKAGGYRPYQTTVALQRLFRPIHDVLDWIGAPPGHRGSRQNVLSVITQEMYQRNTPFWSWSQDTWRAILCPSYTAFQQR